MALPDQLQKGHTYADGDVVNAATLNAMVDEAEVLKGTISEQDAVAAATGDYVLITDTSDSGNLKRALVSSLPGAGTVTSVGFAATPASVFNDSVGDPTTTPDITLELAPQHENLFLAGPATVGLVVPTFRALVPADLPNSVTTIAAYAINCELGNVFKKTLPDNVDRTFTFTAGSGSLGQRIMVYVQQHSSGGTAEVHWAAGSGTIQWPGGTEPVMSTGPSHRDIFEFICLASNSYFGIRWGEDMLT